MDKRDCLATLGRAVLGGGWAYRIARTLTDEGLNPHDVLLLSHTYDERAQR